MTFDFFGASVFGESISWGLKDVFGLLDTESTELAPAVCAVLVNVWVF